MILGFRDAETAKVFQGEVSKKLPRDLQSRARRKLRMLNAAQALDDLRVPPGNRLERLKGHRDGQLSIRINAQWRICFTWVDGHGAQDVEITDYHG